MRLWAAQPAAEALRAPVRRGRTAVMTGWSSVNASLTMGRQRIAVSLVHGILGIRAPAAEISDADRQDSVGRLRALAALRAVGEQ